VKKINFHPEITIHTPIESPCQGVSKNDVFKIFILKSGTKNDEKCQDAPKLVNFE
jgi:hypothetical protein